MTFIVDAFPSYFLSLTDLTSCWRNAHEGGGGTGGMVANFLNPDVSHFNEKNKIPCDGS